LLLTKVIERDTFSNVKGMEKVVGGVKLSIALHR
jgi:hypothetical protein